MVNKANFAPVSLGAGTDLNTLLDGGPYYVTTENFETILNAPVLNTLFLFVFPADRTQTRVLQVASRTNNTSSNGMTVWYRKYIAGVWSEWAPIATATPPQEYDLPLAEGIVRFSQSKSKYFVTQDNVISVNVCVSVDAETIAWGSKIATMPFGYRPNEDVEADVACGPNLASSVAHGAIVYKPDGGVYVYAIGGSALQKGMILRQSGTVSYIAH